MNIVKHFTKLTSGLLAGVLCLLGATACDDEKEVIVPDNWITLSQETLSCTYELDTLTVNYTLAGGLEDKYMYIVNQQEWCKAYTSAPGEIKVAVAASTLLTERAASMTVVYDENHQVEMTLTQGSAPVTPITNFLFDNLPEEVNLLGTVSLNEVIVAEPANASYHEFLYTIPEEQQEGISIDENGVLTAKQPGTYTFTVTSPDEEAFSKEATITVGNYYDRSAWTVTTSMIYAPDGVDINYVPDEPSDLGRVTGMPEDMFDGLTNSFFCLVKPGQSNNGCSTPADAELWFTINFGQPISFNGFLLSHRSSQTAVGLRIHELEIYGSNDGETFTKLGDNYTINTGVTTVEMDMPNTYEYQYLRVLYTKWASSSKSIQISEFNLSYNEEAE